MPDATNIPTAADIIGRLDAVAPDTPSADLLSQIGPILASVIAEFQGPCDMNGNGGTGRRFVPVTETRSYDGSGTSIQRVDDIVPATTITVVAYPSQTITDAVLSDNGYGLGYNSLVRPALAYPYVFPFGVTQGQKRVFPSGINNIAVTATFGFAATAPNDVFEALVCETVSRLLILGWVGVAGAGSSITLGSYSINTAAGVSVWPQSSPIAVFHRIYVDCVERYKDRRQTQPQPSRTIRRMY